jgi:hypothetical protein
MRGRKNIITPEISHHVETLSLMDALLTNVQIKAKVQQRGLTSEHDCYLRR